ncbi:MAG TPA: serine/threonine-protein kinase [Myxococcota bacterium]|nr:serine/threonine-protein kinase [Myxococcota bacterium]
MAENNDRFPREFGKYHLIERIATGGMAELFRAKLYGAGGFEKDLAIKKVLPQFASDDSFVQMFMDEAMITVTLSHGNIVSVLDFGVLDGEYYLVMEFVDGVDLLSLVKKSVETSDPFPPPIASYIALEICRGLDYAHRKVGADGNPLEIVHRDISPQNILVSFEGEVKIVDFGIARAASRITSTQAGVVKGKLAYMAPEQIVGHKVDRRADVYSVGVTLYEMLTNRRPFEGDTPQETIALSTRGIYEKPHILNRKVDKKLSAIVRKAIEKNVKKRYRTAGELAAELSGYLHRAGVYPDATTLAAFIPKRLPDARPRTIQPTPIRAIRRDAETAAAIVPPAAKEKKPALSEREAVAFHMLDLPDYRTEPPDSSRPTDPSRPAVAKDDALLSAQTKILQTDNEAPAVKPPAERDPVLHSAETKLLQECEQAPAVGGEASKYDPALLAAETRMLKATEQASGSGSAEDLAEAWMKGETRLQLDAATETPPRAPVEERPVATGKLQAAAFPKSNLALKIALAFLGLIVVGAVAWFFLTRPPTTENSTARKQVGSVEIDAGLIIATLDAGAEDLDAGRPEAADPSTAAASDPGSADAGSAALALDGGKTRVADKPSTDTVKKPVKKPTKKPLKKPKVKHRVKKPPSKLVRHVVKNVPGKTGTLRINSEPFSVVFLGNKKIGPTPQMNVKLPAGSHTLTLKNEALGLSRRVRVRIEAGKVHTVFVDLKK